MAKKKHYTNKQHWIKQQAALSKQSLFTALHTAALQ